MLKLKKVSKYYYSKGMVATGFSKVDLELKIGEFVAITGESGSGKSTLLNVISGLDSYEEGELYIGGEETSHYTEKDYEVYRRKYIGNIFQNFNLINSYTVYQNVELVLLINGYKRKEVKTKVLEIIEQVGLTKYKKTKVSKLSGGQKQRVAIARCLAKDTPVIIADEPTGNLDSKSAASVLKLLSEISKNKLVIVVTHNYDQVEEYVTRKITMHDGRIIEDLKLQETKEVENVEVSKYKETTILNKIRLGIRNTFNIIPKFLLMLAVYLFIVFAVAGTYSSFKQGEYNASKDGYNNNFTSYLAEKRIILKKDGDAAFTEEDYKKINKIKGIDFLLKKDIIFDNEKSIYNDLVYLYGPILPLSAFDDKVDEGRMPENDDEIILVADKDEWMIKTYKDSILTESFQFDDVRNLETGEIRKLKVVGIKYDDTKYTQIFYVSEKIMTDITNNTYKNNNKTTYSYADKTYTVDPYNYSSSILPSSSVPKGMAYISENNEYHCRYNDCSGYSFFIESESKYYSKDLHLKIDHSYSKNNFYNLFGLNYDEYAGAVFINPEDYSSLFNAEDYQISVFVENDKQARDIENELKEMGYDTFYLIDGLEKDVFVQIVRISKVIVISILLIVLFFISYFVIKLILKSRNVYFSTIRMLGSSSKTAKNLLDIELGTIATITYIILLSLILLVKVNLIQFEYLQDLLTYLTLKEYILIYLILIIMSYLTSTRYARKLFKNSAISTLREEV